MYDVAAVRKDFPIFDNGLAYLDSANTSQRPRQVTGAMMEYFERYNSHIHRAAANGARIEYVDIDERGELRLDQFRELLERGPRLVAFSQVSNALGTINPVEEMVDASKRAGATVLVDGAQGAPHRGVDVRALG